jgi:hypothetical protein
MKNLLHGTDSNRLGAGKKYPKTGGDLSFEQFKEDLDQYPFEYKNYSESLKHDATSYALTTIIAAQFIFFNLHYILGGILTILALIAITVQIILNIIEKVYIDRRTYKSLQTTLEYHFWINHIQTLLYIPFYIWAVVIMYQLHFNR